MNQPTREEFEAFKQEIRQEVRQLKEQRTEEMKAINVNVASADVLDRLDKLDNALEAHSEAWLKALQENFQESKADFLALRESQADFRDRLNVTATKEDLNQLEIRIDSKLAPINATLAEILNRLPPKQ
jgi:exonuclease VII large subunit